MAEHSDEDRFEKRTLLIGATLMAVAVAAVVGVWLVARDAPSSNAGMVDGIPYVAATGPEGCQSFGEYWIRDSGVTIDPVVIENFTNCRIDADGNWTVAASLPRPELPEGTDADAAETRAEILAGVDLLEASLPQSLKDELGSIYSDSDNPVIGHQREGVTISPVRERYARIVNGLMLDPDQRAFTDYLGWYMGKRIAGYAALRTACLDDPDTEYLYQPCVGLEDNLSVRYAPWPWDLRNLVNLDAYLAERYATEG